ncbi:MAG: hypothetical protein LUG99_15515, partial [Lachnospiraceae bacterium]|nr:hypothetical protein [Lachnospiraceae bacterium]
HCRQAISNARLSLYVLHRFLMQDEGRAIAARQFLMRGSPYMSCIGRRPRRDSYNLRFARQAVQDG